MKTLFAVALASFMALRCASILRPCDGSSYPAFDRDNLIRRVKLAEAKREWLAQMEIETLPPEARAGVTKSVEESFETFAATTVPGDELWRYRFEKCAGCGWYTEGIVALRGPCIAAELTMKDDM